MGKERYQFFCQNLVISFYQKVILKRKREHSTLNFVFLIETLCEVRRKEEMWFQFTKKIVAEFSYKINKYIPGMVFNLIHNIEKFNHKLTI